MTYLQRLGRNNEISYLQDWLNVRFNQTGAVDIGVYMIAPHDADRGSPAVIGIAVLQNKIVRDAALGDVEFETFDHALSTSNMTITAAGQTFAPIAVRWKKKYWTSLNLRSGLWANNFSYVWRYAIYCDRELPYTSSIALNFPGDNFGGLPSISFIPSQTMSPVIRVLRRYDIGDPNRKAKLAYYDGLDGVDYPNSFTYNILDSADVIVESQILNASTRTPKDSFTIINASAADYVGSQAGTEVHDIRLNFLPAGDYRIEIPGIGRSPLFNIGSGLWQAVNTMSARSLYVQRAFIAIGPPSSTYTRQENTILEWRLAQNFSEYYYRFFLGSEDHAFDIYKGAPSPNAISGDAGTTIYSLTGGWHDAGDFDTKVFHMRTIDRLCGMYLEDPDYWETQALPVPETGTLGIPDIIHECLWGVLLWNNIQDIFNGLADAGNPEYRGAVSGGYQFVDHPTRASWEEENAYIYAPDIWAAQSYTRSAAKLAITLRVVAQRGAATLTAAELSNINTIADDLETRAIAAWNWAANPGVTLGGTAEMASRTVDGGNTFRLVRQSAALNLYEMTGDVAYHTAFRAEDRRENYLTSRDYLILDSATDANIDASWQLQLLTRLIDNANAMVALINSSGYGVGSDPDQLQSFGGNPMQVGQSQANVLTTAYYVVRYYERNADNGNPRDLSAWDSVIGSRQAVDYLNALAENLYLGMGVNPDNWALGLTMVSDGLAYMESSTVLSADAERTDQVIPVWQYGHGYWASTADNTNTALGENLRPVYDVNSPGGNGNMQRLNGNPSLEFGHLNDSRAVTIKEFTMHQSAVPYQMATGAIAAYVSENPIFIDSPGPQPEPEPASTSTAIAFFNRPEILTAGITGVPLRSRVEFQVANGGVSIFPCNRR